MDAPTSKVLIIDDDVANLLLLESILEKSGYIALSASDGKSGIALAENERPDLILLDVVMPGIDGYETAERLKCGKNGVSKTPIIFITGLESVDDKVKAFESGGIDCVSKPFSEREVIARVTAHLKLKFQYEVIEKLNLQNEKEIALAGKIQSSLFAGRAITRNNLEAYCEYRPFEKVGGDFYDVVELSPDKTMIVIADVTGHAIPASLYTAMLRANLNDLMHQESEPCRILERINQAMAKVLYVNHYLTGVVVVHDRQAGEILWANAGHCHPIMVRANVAGAQTLEFGGPLLGLIEELKYEQKVKSVGPGDRLFLYTDGLVDVGQQQTVDPPLAVHLDATRALSLEDWVNDSVRHIQEQPDFRGFDDDLTVLAVEFK